MNEQSNNKNTVDVNELLAKLISNQTNQSKKSEEEVIDLKELFFKYLKHWWWFVISVVLCVALTYLYLQTQNSMYAVDATIMIRNDEGSQMPDLGMLGSFGMLGNSKMVEDELYIINSANIMQQVVENLNIRTTYAIKDKMKYVEQYPVPSIEINYPTTFCDTLKRKVKVELRKNKNDYKVKIKYRVGLRKIRETYTIDRLELPFKTKIGTFSFTEHRPLEVGDKMRMEINSMIVTVETYRSLISANQVKNESNVIQIATTTATPRKAIDMINEMVRLYNLDAVIDKNIMASNTAQFIEERLQIVTKELNSVEMDVENYMTRNKLTDIESETELYLETASEYQKKLAEIETQLNLVSFIQAHVQDPKNQFSLIPSNLGVEDPALVLLVQEYNKSLLERMKLLRTTNIQNPVIIQLENQLQIVRDNIITSIGSLKEGIIIAKQDVVNKDKQFEERIKSVPSQARQYIEIKRQQLIKETLYTYLYEKREENAVTLASTVQPAKTIDTARYYPDPVAPRKLIILLISMILGGIIPIGILFIRNFINNKIEDEEEYEKIIKAPVTGYICNSNGAERIVVKDGVTSSIVELFRLIRTNLNFLVSDKKNPTILITSSISGEGKSFIAANLACSFALLKKKVVIVGLDIRNPSLSQYMGITEKGALTSYLSSTDYGVEDVIFPTNIDPYLDIVPAGTIPPNPGELLIRERLDDLIAYLKTKYDYVLIDSAPIGMVSDTFLLNRFADLTLYVSRANYTPRNLVNLINSTYQNKRLNNMVCVINSVKLKTGFGYGYGYSNKK